MQARPMARRGFTLIEIIVAMSLTLVVFAITLPFMRVQTRALGASAGRLDAEQIARYAQRAIDHDLRLAAGDPGQPVIVYAGPMGISFNANLLAPDTTDLGARSLEPGAPTTLTEAWRVADAAALPLTAVTYPTEDYVAADGTPSRTETISYFLHPDTVSDRSDVYVLFRRVNARDSVQLVRGIHVPADSAFFTYLRIQGGTPTPIASGSLPLFWGDTLLAGVRAVGLRSAGFYRNRQDQVDVIRTVFWRTVIPNAMTAMGGECGGVPANPSGVSVNAPTNSNFRVRVSWMASATDQSGTTDVRHYVVRVRSISSGDTAIVAQVPARGTATYQFDHELPTMIGTVRYGVQAVGCDGSRSATVEHTSNLTLP